MEKIVYKRLDELQPYENNPRSNDKAVPAVAESIRQFGFKVPIVIDGAGVIVAGHTRHKAAESLGLEHVPCIVAEDLTDEQVRAFRLADNKTGELASWDIEQLMEELGEITELDMDALGFADLEEIDIDSFFADAPEQPDHEQPEAEGRTVECPHCGMSFEV